MSRDEQAAASVRCGRVVDPGAAYPHPCVLPEGHDGPCDGRSPEARSAASVRWTVYGRIANKPHNYPPSTAEWTEWLTFFSEGDGLEALDDYRVQYPHYEIELRKVTTMEERVDA